LKEGLKLYGRSWHLIAKHVGRKPSQCAAKAYQKKLIGDLECKDEWTDEQVENLKKGVGLYQENWTKISGLLEGT
jgi:hypothetical protein